LAKWHSGLAVRALSVRVGHQVAHGLGLPVAADQVKVGVGKRDQLDSAVGGSRAAPIETRRKRVEAEAERLARHGASFVGVPSEEGLDHYAVAMQEPEGNEFDIN
jgi:hypothetical protein